MTWDSSNRGGMDCARLFRGEPRCTLESASINEVTPNWEPFTAECSQVPWDTAGRWYLRPALPRSPRVAWGQQWVREPLAGPRREPYLEVPESLVVLSVEALRPESATAPPTTEEWLPCLLRTSIPGWFRAAGIPTRSSCDDKSESPPWPHLGTGWCCCSIHVPAPTHLPALREKETCPARIPQLPELDHGQMALPELQCTHLPQRPHPPMRGGRRRGVNGRRFPAGTAPGPPPSAG